jgi:hypothetical protein
VVKRIEERPDSTDFAVRAVECNLVIEQQTEITMNRYAAKLLFQFRVTIDGESGKRRLCEERIVLFKAPYGAKALADAKRRGKKEQHRYKNIDGNPVRFEFIGVMELLCLDPACDEDEVWYDFVERLLPSERRAALIPAESDLEAIRNESPKN